MAMIIKKAYGCFVEDINGNRFIDTTMGSGAQIIGHGNQLTRKLCSQIRNGTIYTIPNCYTEKVNYLLKTHINPEMHDSYVYCSTGTEANMRACRLARAYTSKDIIGRFHGGWHGGIDGFLDDHPDNKGVPKNVNDLVRILSYNEEEAISLIDESYAAFIVETVQGSNPRSDVKFFLEKLRNRCNETGTLLIFDEVMTGFRLSKRGGAGLFGITPDIVTYGKVLGAGFPIGVVGGKTHIMKTKGVFYGGTFSANPVSMHAANLILETIVNNKLIDYTFLESTGLYFREQLNDYFVKENKKIRAIGCGPLNRLVFTDKFIRNKKERDEFENSSIQNQFYETLQKEGVFVNTNRLFHFSMSHSREILEQTIEKIKVTSNLI